MDGSPPVAAAVTRHERRHAGHARAARRPRPPRAQHRALAAGRRRRRRAPPPAHQDAQERRDRRASSATPGAHGIAVAKVGEAEVFAQAGFDDIVDRLSRRRRGEVAAARRARRARAHHASTSTARRRPRASAPRRARAGVDRPRPDRHRLRLRPLRRPRRRPRRDRGARAARSSSCPGLDLDGVTTHRGLFFEGADEMSLDEAGRARGRAASSPPPSACARRGIEVREVTAGGSLTRRRRGEHVDGVTEVRAGTYVFNDLMQIALGVGDARRSARSPSSPPWSASTGDGHGDDRRRLEDVRGRHAASSAAPGSRSAASAEAVERDVVVERMTEEHGLVRSFDGPLAIGERLTFVPVHACTCVNLADAPARRPRRRDRQTSGRSTRAGGRA